MKSNLRKAGIIGVGTYLPEKIVTNSDLEKVVDTTNEWIYSRTGIAERRVAKDDQATSDLAIIAAKKALEHAAIDAAEIDLIIVATITPDMIFPATASIIQEQLKAKKAAAFDLSAGCTGFVYALSVANQFVATGAYDKVLVIGAETLTRIVDWQDRKTCVLFGDGAGAVVVGPVNENEGFLSFVLGSDGSGAELLYMPAGGSRKPPSLETLSNKEHSLRMSGSDVFKFAVKIMGEAAAQALIKSGHKLEDIDFMIPHQANTRIIESAAKRLGLSMEKVFMNLDKYGNMSCASIPVALEEAYHNNLLKKGDLVVFVGFGAGLSWGACALKWSI